MTKRTKPRPKTKEEGVKETFDKRMDEPGTAKSFVSLFTGMPEGEFTMKRITVIPETFYPDLLIRHKGQYYAFEFFATENEDTIAGQAGVMTMGILKTIPHCELSQSAIWVGDGIVLSDIDIERGSLHIRCKVIDIREAFEKDRTHSASVREILSRLKEVHLSRGGLFKRLLELPPEAHQREFVRIAQELGYEATAMKVVMP